MGGKAGLLIDPCTKGARAPHSGEFASTGSGKSAALATKIITWTGSSVVVDPTIELGPLLDKVLRKQRKRVFHIGIPNPKKPIKMTGVNVLRWIDTSHPEVNSHIRSVVSWIYDEHAAAEAMEAHGYSADDPFFGKMGRTLVRCLLAHVIWSNPDDVEITLTAFAAGISTPERDMVALLHKIHANSPSKVARRLAGSLMEARAAETFSGVYLNAIAGCEWLSSIRSIPTSCRSVISTPITSSSVTPPSSSTFTPVPSKWLRLYPACSPARYSTRSSWPRGTVSSLFSSMKQRFSGG
jgi:type IV secretion system protein VirD4